MAYEDLKKLSTADLKHALKEHLAYAEITYLDAIRAELKKRNEDPDQ